MKRLSRATIDALAEAAAKRRVTVAEMNRDLGLRIDETTAACLWSGERMDYDMAVGGLITYRDRARQTQEAAT